MKRGVERSSAGVRLVRAPAPSDRALVQEARAGALWAKEALFKRHAPMAFRIAARLLGTRDDVPDVVQESFLAVLSSLHRLKESDVFSTWLGQIVVHMVYRVRRRERLLTRLGIRNPVPVDPSSLLSPSVPQDVAVEFAAIYDKVDRLPEKQRIALIMRRIEGRELSEIAVLMRVSIPTVKRLLTRAGEALGTRDDAITEGQA
jgi:RNA polymerase sigma-70 factor (ECF subfamily)